MFVILVLGMTKGFTQSNRMSSDPRTLDGVAFANSRPRLLQSLQAIGLLKDVRNIDPKLTALAKNYGSASVVRCSLSAFDGEESVSSTNAMIATMRHPDAVRIFPACVKT